MKILLNLLFMIMFTIHLDATNPLERTSDGTEQAAAAQIAAKFRCGCYIAGVFIAVTCIPFMIIRFMRVSEENGQKIPFF